MSKSIENNIRYEVITQEDKNGDLLIPIPLPLLERLGWKEGQDVVFGIDDAGKLYIKGA